jgi:hypothetical protein
MTFSLGLVLGQNKAPALNFSICHSSYEPDSGWHRVHICMHASAEGSYHSRGQVYLDVKEESLSKIPDSAIIVRHLELLGAQVEGLPMPRYETINMINNGNSIVLTWAAKNLGLAANSKMHTEVLTEAKGLYEILIPTETPLTPSLNASLMDGQTFFITEDDKMEKPYNAWP